MSESFERLAAWRESINLDLMNAAIHLVVSSSMRSDSVTELMRELRCQPWYERADAPAYFAPVEIRYMGELLERYAEKYGNERKHYRAVALALAFSLPCAEDSMFVGNQRRAFMKRLEKDAKNDLYLQIALYLLEPAQQAAIQEQILGQQHTDAAALLFALTVFPSEAVQKLRPQFIRLLGKERMLSVFGNSGLYATLFREGGEAIRACRQKDNAILKSLLSLCDGYVRSDSRPDTVLRAHGYSRLEICFLNAALLWESNLALGFYLHGSPAEKLAVEFVTLALNAREKQPAAVMDFIELLLRKYARFEIKINGYSSLWNAIKSELHPECPDTVAWMTQHIEDRFDYCFDVLDSRWDTLPALVSEEKYHDLFRMQLALAGDTVSEQIVKMLERYHTLTGNTYADVFKAYAWEESQPFKVLVDAGVILLSDYFAAHEHEPGNTYNHYSCMHYILEYAANVTTRKAYDFWAWFFTQYSVRDFSRYFGARKSFDEPFIRAESYSYGRCYGIKLDIVRDFLSPEEQRKLYEWADESYFCFHADKYASFQSQALQNELVRKLFTPEELRQTFDALLATEPQAVSDQLKLMYYTAEEKQRDADEKAARRAQEERAAIEKTRSDLIERIEKDFDGSFSSAWRLAERTWRDQEMMAELLLPRVLEQYESCAHRLIRKEMIALTHLCAYFLKHKADFLPTFKSIFAQMEEVTPDDRSSSAAESADNA